MLNCPKVSVIIPFLNRSNFLPEAIDSVLAQTYTSWELFLIDDGSSDESTRIAKAFASEHVNQIRYLEHSGHANRGKPASRNLGISSSRSEYIALLDSDDVWSNTLLHDQVAILDKHRTVAMTFGPMKLWRNWNGAESPAPDRLQTFTFRTDRVIKPPSFVPLLLSERNDPAGCLIRRRVLDEVGLYENNFDMCEDWALYIKIALQYDIYVSSKCNYFYRQHPAQSCSRLRCDGRFYDAFIPFLAWLKTYLTSVQCDDPEVMQAMARLIRRNRFYRVRESVTHTARGVFRYVLNGD